ncbi:hypothetical protein P5G65_33890 [Paenibacillus chondroitinus]|uniref:ChrB N-terminal domain-containing protein n=1 Tax=Paenibacillus chondroitinus TaxID=59842 RepID=A0ABU6DM79_9BACL|nr:MULTISPECIES: Chromate resistance protein ChrB [Paenibacillus]MCY9661978.1 hypothetical protein [Paenibacillus anseongense]MEB4798898.1 hypothetical protein [Paenibacillus chondroitinus]
MSANEWLLLSYRVPAEPSSKRVSIWRKIRGIGAIYIQNGVCILPKNEEHQRQVKMIKNEIVTNGGDALLFETSGLDQKEEEQIIQRFNDEKNEEYKEFLGKCKDYLDELKEETEQQHFTYAELQENDEELKKLKQWLDKIKKLDFYKASLQSEAEEELLHCEQMLDHFAHEVFNTESNKTYE